MRYADDFVILARFQSRRLRDWVESTLEGRFRLQINRQKTQVVNLTVPGASLDFLGFTFRYDRDLYGRDRHYLNVFPSRKAVDRAREKLRELTDSRRCFVPVTDMIDDINRWSQGWAGYFSHGYPQTVFHTLNGFLTARLTKHLQRRSQRSFRCAEGRTFYAHLRALGLRILERPP